VLFQRDLDHHYRVSDWDEFPWLEHGFGTRHSLWPEPHRCATLKQIHSADSYVAREAGCCGSGDALLSNEAGLCLSIRTADCVPIFLVDPVNRAVAAIHAGWRGTAVGIAAQVVLRMEEEFGTKPDAIQAAIGPAIGPCCYEVGPDVAERLRKLFPERDDLHIQTRIDLSEANRRQLIDSGVRPQDIAIAGMCTFCMKEDFHSFRRDRDLAGRLVSTIGIRNEP